MQNSLVLASWKIVSSWKCRCGTGSEMCLEHWGRGAVQVVGALSRGGGLCAFGMQRDSPPLPFPEILLATQVGVFGVVLSCLYLLVQDWTSHLFIGSEFVFPFSCALPGAGKHVSGSCCYWQPAEQEHNCKGKVLCNYPYSSNLRHGLAWKCNSKPWPALWCCSWVSPGAESFWAHGSECVNAGWTQGSGSCPPMLN